MQTFLPYPSFMESAQALDRQRLGKQRVEGLQILRALNGDTKGWVNHPATKMWRGHEMALVQYTFAMCIEWKKRGYKDTCMEKIALLADDNRHSWGGGDPVWLGDEALHRSHRSNLLRKAPEHYGLLWSDVPDDLPYVWPVS